MFSFSRRRTAAAVAAVAVGATALGTGLAVTSGSASARPAGSSSSSSSSNSAAAAAKLRSVCHAASAKKATVVLVHGAFAETSAWNGELAELTKAGCNVRAISNPLRSLRTDSRTVADFAESLPGPVILVGHSYGGSVITNAGAEAHNVVGLVYVDAAAPAPGETTSQLSGKNSAINTEPPSKVFTMVNYGGAPKGAKDMYLTKNFFLTKFGQDLPRAEATSLWESQNAASSAALMGKSQYAAWKTLPSWYFISTGDKIITPNAERHQAKRAHSHVTVFHGGSHLSLVSHPKAVTAVIEKALAGTVAR